MRRRVLVNVGAYELHVGLITFSLSRTGKIANSSLFAELRGLWSTARHPAADIVHQRVVHAGDADCNDDATTTVS